MKPNSFSTLELADLLLSQTSDWVLIRVNESYGVFENPEGEFLLTRSEIVEHLKRQGIWLTRQPSAAESRRIIGVSYFAQQI